MTKPNAAAWVVGNPLIFIGALLLGIFFGWQALNGGDGGDVTLAVICLFLTVMGAKASERIRDYKNWKREWAIMGGQPDPRLRAARNFRWLHRVVGTTLWVAILWYVTVTPDMAGYAAYLWFATLFLLGFWAVWRVRQRGKTKAATRAAATMGQAPIVALCVAVPPHSPDYNEFHNALPEHCWELFR